MKTKRIPNPKIIEKIEVEMYDMFNEAQEAQFVAETLEKILNQYKKTGIMTKQMKETLESPYMGFLDEKTQ